MASSAAEISPPADDSATAMVSVRYLSSAATGLASQVSSVTREAYHRERASGGSMPAEGGSTATPGCPGFVCGPRARRDAGPELLCDPHGVGARPSTHPLTVRLAPGARLRGVIRHTAGIGLASARLRRAHEPPGGRDGPSRELLHALDVGEAPLGASKVGRWEGTSEEEERA